MLCLKKSFIVETQNTNCTLLIFVILYEGEKTKSNEKHFERLQIFRKRHQTFAYLVSGSWSEVIMKHGSANPHYGTEILMSKNNFVTFIEIKYENLLTAGLSKY